MSQQTDPAILVRLQSANEALIGQKMRLAGRLLAYDNITGLILLLDQGHAILVDVTLCIDHWSGGWVRDYLGTIRVIGHLEASPEELPIPTLPTYAPAPALEPKLVVRAVLVERAADLDMDLWNKAIEERQGAQ